MILSVFLGLAGALPKLVNPTSIGVGLCIFFVCLFGGMALRPFKTQIWNWVLKVLKKKPLASHKLESNGRQLQEVIEKRAAAEKEIVRRVTDQCKEGRRNLGVGNPEKCSVAEPCKYCQDLIQKAKEKPEDKKEEVTEAKP